MISFNYNKQRVFLSLIFSFVMLSFFAYLFFNANELALIKPTSYIYGYVGVLFYENENLIKIISVIIILFFVYFTISLPKMLIKKNIVFKIQNGFLFQDNKSIIEISKVESLELKKYNRNHFIIINLIEKDKIIDKDKNIFRKIFNFGDNKTLNLNIDFINNKPKDTLEKLQKLIIA